MRSGYFQKGLFSERAVFSLGGEAIEVGEKACEDVCEGLHSEEFAGVVAGQDHRDAEGLALEALMVGRFACEEPIAALLRDQGDQAAATSADDPEFGDRCVGLVSNADRRIGQKGRDGGLDLGDGSGGSEYAADPGSQIQFPQFRHRGGDKGGQVFQSKSACPLPIDSLVCVVPCSVHRVDRDF